MVFGAKRAFWAQRGLLAFLIALVGLVVSGNFPVHAQGFSATVTGSVKDTSGAAVPGAMVTAKHLETDLTRVAEVDATGNYRIESLPVGAYQLTVEKMGFEQEVRRGINLVVAQEAVVDFTLQVGSVVQQVTVTEAAPLINATTTSTSGLISEQQIKELPLNGRSFDQLLTLNVGMANNSSNVQNWTAFSVAGKRPETNRFLINGVDYIGGSASGLFITPSGASGMLLGVDAVREYNVLPNSYGAEYGKRAGGQISVVTSSGTNQLHGDVFEYVRNNVFDARNFYDPTPSAPPFRRNQFGASLGGPIKRDKLFLFGSYEGFRQRWNVPNDAIVPGTKARLGILPNGTTTGVKPQMVAYANAFWPTPTGPDRPDGTAHSLSNPSQPIREDFGVLRFDYTISGADSFSANYTVDNGFRGVPQIDPVFSQLSDIHDQVASLQETHIFSPRLVNVATFGYTRAFAVQVNAPAVPIPANLVFLPGGNPGSIIIGGGIITAAPSAVAAASGNNPYRGARNHFTWADDVHFNRGKHSWSTGVWIHRVQENLSGAAQGSAGNVAYQNITTFLQDKPNQAILVRNPVPVGYRSWEGAWYVQDEIALRRNLNLRLGLRDEMTDGWNEEAGRCTNYFYDSNFVIQTNPNIGVSCLQTNNATHLLQLAWASPGTQPTGVPGPCGLASESTTTLWITWAYVPTQTRPLTPASRYWCQMGSFLSFRSRRMPCSRPPAARGYLNPARSIKPPVSIRTCSRPLSRNGALQWSARSPETL